MLGDSHLGHLVKLQATVGLVRFARGSTGHPNAFHLNVAVDDLHALHGQRPLRILPAHGHDVWAEQALKGPGGHALHSYQALNTVCELWGWAMR